MPRRSLFLAVLFLIVVAATLLIIQDEPTSSGAADRLGGRHGTEPADDLRSESALGAERSPEPLQLSPTAEASAAVEPPAPEAEPVEPVLPEAPLLVEVVYRDGGNPVEGAYVRVVSRDSISGELLSEVTARTNNAGLCQVTLLLGTLGVAVWTEAHEYGQGGLQHNGGGELERVRIEVERLASVSGVVRDPEGRPIEGARVSSTTSRSIGAPAITSDQQGEFGFHDWPVGQITSLSFDAAGYGKEIVTLLVEEDARWCQIVESGEYEWRGGTGAYVEVVLEPAMKIRGTLVDSDGRPVTKGRVRASGVAESSAPILLGDVAEAETTSDGTFELQDLRSDVAHLVMCEAPGEGIAVRSTPASAGSIELGTIPLSGSGLVTGRFVDRWERPISGALLELTLPAITTLAPGGVDESVFYGNPSRLLSSSQVAADGEFEVAGPSVKGLQLAVKLGFRTLWNGPIDLSAGDVDLGPVRVDTEFQTMTGHLLTADGKPARLDIIGGNGSLWARVETGRDGTFQFVTLDGSPESVTIVQRSEAGLPINRWTRESRSFPVMLQTR